VYGNNFRTIAIVKADNFFGQEEEDVPGSKRGKLALSNIENTEVIEINLAKYHKIKSDK
jgi:hypothetical protein